MYKLIFIFILSVSSLFAQDKIFTMEEAILGSSGKLKIKDLNLLQWIENTNEYCYEDSLKNEFGLIKGQVNSNSLQMLLALDSLNEMLLYKTGEFSEFYHFPEISWKNRDTFGFLHDRKYFTYSFNSKSLELINEVPDNSKNISIDEQSGRIAFTQGQNLFIAMKPDDVIQVTNDTEEGIRNGDKYVHRAEFGIDSGIFWSPQANYLAFYRVDERMVTQYPLVDLDSRPAKVRHIRYPMAGMAIEQVQIGIFHINTGSITYLQTGEPRDQYLASVTWSPDEKFIYVVHLNRDQNHLQFIKYNPYTGRPLKILFEEKNSIWVEPLHKPIFLPNNPDRFLWFSKRDGFNHLYLYDSGGKLIRQLTKGNFDLTDIEGFEKQGKNIFVTAASEDGLERHGWMVSLEGRMKKLTSRKGTNTVTPSADGKYFINRLNNHQTPNDIAIIDNHGELQKELLTAPNPCLDYKLGEIKYIKIKNKVGIDLNSRMILPVDFSPNKKYPVIVYVYGGPHNQMVTDSWIKSWHLWYQYMAQQGYIVFSLDNRGTGSRGLEFEQAVFKRLGTFETADQMAGVSYLKSLAFVDSARIGIHGWSYGGFLTISLLTRYPSVFKTGIAGGPVIDWRFYEAVYGERYMDTPQSNPDGYDEANLLNYAQNLDAPLLIIHGTVDPIVPWQNSLLYLRKAVDEGIQLDYFVYPGDEHNMKGRDRVHLYQKITDYFKMHLQ